MEVKPKFLSRAHLSAVLCTLYSSDNKTFADFEMFITVKSITSFCCYCLSVTKWCLTLWAPWTAAHQAPLSFSNSLSLLKLTSIESLMPSNHLILCRPLLLVSSNFPSIRVFSVSQLLTSGGQSIGALASAPVLPVNIEDWFPLGWTGLISLLSRGLWRVFSSTIIWKYQFFSTQPSLWSNSYISACLLEKT